MYRTPEQIREWRTAKRDWILPIVYVRGFAMTGGEIDDTSVDPFNGFNVGSMLLRTSWTGDSTRHVFESPVLRLTQEPYNYRVVFSHGLDGLDEQTQSDFAAWKEDEQRNSSSERSPHGVLAIYRYYEIASKVLSDGVRPGMPAYGWGLGRLITDLMSATGAPGVYLVAHSMGGLVARTLLQNLAVPTSPFIATQPRQLSQAEWDAARKSVLRFFTYGTPHNGITGQGGLGNALLGSAGSLLGMEIENFSRPRICEYLGGASEANSLDGHYPVRNTFCLVGTAAADYPVAGGLSRRLIGQYSDGLVEIDNAVAHGPAPADSSGPTPGETVLAARAYVRRAHSGPYGMVNSEEGFGNLSRFLFGDARVDGDLLVRRVGKPRGIAEALAAQPEAELRASYSFETSLRVRGERWVLSERRADNGSALFRKYDELFPQPGPVAGPGGTPVDPASQPRGSATDPRHRRVDLFTVFLDTKLRAVGETEMVAGEERANTLGFAFRLRVLAPDYEVGSKFLQDHHYEGSALLDQDLVFIAFPDGAGWQLAWGPNRVDFTSADLTLITATAEPADMGTAWRRDLSDAIEFYVPLVAGGIGDSGPGGSSVGGSGVGGSGVGGSGVGGSGVGGSGVGGSGAGGSGAGAAGAATPDTALFRAWLRLTARRCDMASPDVPVLGAGGAAAPVGGLPGGRPAAPAPAPAGDGGGARGTFGSTPPTQTEPAAGVSGWFKRVLGIGGAG